MALIKVDPSQTKPAAALIGVLVVVCGITVVRLKPQAVAQAPARTQAQPAEVTPAGPPCDGLRPPERARNPFDKPRASEAVVQRAGCDAGAGGLDTRLAAARTGIAPLPLPQLRDGMRTTFADIEPVRPVSPPATGVAQSPQPNTGRNDRDTNQTRSSYVLLATVRGAGGFSGVIRSAESGPTLVEVGDKVDGCYTVIALNADRAVLTDGRETIVAERAH